MKLEMMDFCVILQLPFILHGDVKVPDSTFIIKYLTNTYPDKVQKLTAEQEGLSVMVTGYLDFKFVANAWACRWIYDEVRIPSIPFVTISCHFSSSAGFQGVWKVFCNIWEMQFVFMVLTCPHVGWYGLPQTLGLVRHLSGEYRRERLTFSKDVSFTM
jgi:hypothetical protein